MKHNEAKRLYDGLINKWRETACTHGTELSVSVYYAWGYVVGKEDSVLLSPSNKYTLEYRAAQMGYADGLDDPE